MAEQYLAPKNWEKRQPGRSGKSEWIKDYTDKDTDDKYDKLSFYQRQVLDGIRRLRGRLGKNPPNDAAYIARALHAVRTDRPHVAHAVSTLIARGDLLLTDQEFDTQAEPQIKSKKESKKKKEKEPSAAPSACGPQVSKAIAETRHERIQCMVFSAYREQNGVDPPWDGGEGKQLQALLKATPQWHDGQLAQCLTNMYASGGFAKGTRPREFLPRLPKYLHGPLNEFNREKAAEQPSRPLSMIERENLTMTRGR